MATIYPRNQAAPRALADAVPARRVITVEHVLFVVLGVLAVLVHLYALGSRSLHHDETLHAQFSWRIYTGEGYKHDPLLHGPFLYYISAAMMFLFGDTDTTSRLSAALFGIGLTMLPLLARRELGRGAALLTSGYLLISPVALYVGRFIRHDIYAVVFEVLMVVGLLRFIRTQRAMWHYVVAAAAALMLVTMESFFLFLLIWLSFVVFWLLWQVSRRALALLAGYVVVAVVALKGLPRLGIGGALPEVSESQALGVRHQLDNQWGVYFQKVAEVLGPFLRHPAIILLLLATLAFLVGTVVLVWVLRDKAGQSAWQRAAAASEPGTLLYAVNSISRWQWAKAWLLAFVIYLVFYTGVLSNFFDPNVTALVTGVSGSLLYWMGQHGVRRGGQPAHFYLFEIFLYDPLLLWGLAIALVLTVRRFFTSRRIHAALGDEPARPAWIATARTHDLLFAPALLVWWSLGALAIYSWAGEKMPWLTIHMVVPLAFLTGWAIARLGSYAFRDGVGTRAKWLLGLLLAVGALCLIKLNNVSQDGIADVGTAWIWVWGPILLAVIVVALVGLLGNRRQALAVAMIVVLTTLLPYTLRSSLRLSFQTGDVAVEPMVFVQTSPDVKRVMTDLERAKGEFGSARTFGVRYDNETVWQWYLRDYSDDGGQGSPTTGPIPDDIQAVFLLYENAQANSDNLVGFASQRYPLRWWLPECDIYRLPGDALGSCGADTQSLMVRLLKNPFRGQTMADWWQFAMYRKLPSGLGSSDWVLYVRPAIAPLFGMGPTQRYDR